MSTTGYRIEAKPLGDRFARGWHCLGLAADYRDGKPHTLNIFGRRLAAFADSTGQIRVVDSFCPHMGGDLSTGTVQGDELVCPFHGWKWGGDGACKEIPYCKRVPLKARIGSWTTSEQNHLLFIWHDPEGKAPPPEVAIPRIDACYSDEWHDWAIDKMVINTNCRELVDNISDMAHFDTVHGTKLDYFANLFEGHKATQLMIGCSKRLSGEDRLTALSTYLGPAYHITQMTGSAGGQPINSILLNCHVPIDQNSFELRYGVLVKRIPSLPEEQSQAIAQAYVQQAREAFYEDVSIWASKARIDNPVMCEADGPIYQAREWYGQFYVDADAVTPNSVARRVVELNPGGIEPSALHHVFEA